MRKPLTLALSFVGLFASLYLFYSYTSPSRPMVCIGTGCEAVRASSYSTLWGLPMPLYGILGYALLAMVVIAEPLFSASLAGLARWAFLGMTGFGFLFSLYLEYLQGFVIHAYCAWCVTSAVAMTALFALAIVDLVRAERPLEPAARLARVRGLFAVCLAATLLGVPAFYLLARRSELPPPAPQATPANLAERLAPPGSHQAGNPQGPLTVVEFGDFECPVCARGEATARAIRTRYASQVRFVFRQFPLESIHPFAGKAAEASECAGKQGKFWEMVEKLYSRQDDLTIGGLERDAAELGMDRLRFNQCLASGAMAPRVHQDAEDGRALGVRATPTFFVGQKRIEGVVTADRFSQFIDEQLAGSGGDPQATAAAPLPHKSSGSKVGQALPPATPNASPSLPAAAPGGLAIGLPGASPVGLLAGAQSSGATCSEADAAKKQPTEIDTPELRQLLTSDAKLLFVDVRPAADYAAGRIPGAVNVPADEIDRRWNALPKDRTIVLYESGKSSGDICAAGRSVGRGLLEHGFPFSQVKVYRDGLAGWQKSGIAMNQ